MQPVTPKRIVCLANSRKLSGRCIAGKEILEDGSPGEWVRPVSDRPNEEVSEYERQYEDGSDPSVLDVVEIPMLKARPKNYQQENWLLDPEYYWDKIACISWDDLGRLSDLPVSLWVNGHSSNNGYNDRVPESIADSLESSLYLIKASRMELDVSQPGLAFGNRKRSVQGRFQYNGTDYWLRVTDPRHDREYLRRPNGSYSLGECFLTISLGDLYRGYAYKLIAAVIRPE